MKRLLASLSTSFDWFYVPHISVTDIIEIIIVSYLLYHVILWFKKTRAWTLFKGMVVFLIFTAFAALFQLNTILWIVKNAINVGILAVIILFQPELRRALEELGRKNIISDVLTRDDKGDKNFRVNDQTIQEIIAAATDMVKIRQEHLL